MTDRNYIITLGRKPDMLRDFGRYVRYDLDDAREEVARHNARFPQAPARLWKVERDGTVAEVTP